MTHKFLIQVDEVKKPSYDFCYQMIEACNYKTWFDVSNPYVYSLSEDIGITAFNNYTPIGSVEFVHNFLKQYHNIPEPKPINIPKELFKRLYLQRDCYYAETKNIIINKPTFVKSEEKIKIYTEIVNNKKEIPDGFYFISEPIKIDSEWRAFVFNRKLVGLQNYSGDFTIMPNIFIIQSMIDDYNDCSPAYTLDIGINNNDGTFLIEVHNFYSCGLYGFADYRILPDMFEQSFKWITNQYKKEVINDKTISR